MLVYARLQVDWSATRTGACVANLEFLAEVAESYKMDHLILKKALKVALLDSQDEISTNQSGKNSPRSKTEDKFTKAFVRALNDQTEIVSATDDKKDKKLSLAKWGGFNVKEGSKSGEFDVLVETEESGKTCNYALEVKVVGFPPEKGGGFSVIQIAQDALRLILLDHDNKISGGWIIILGIGEDIKDVNTAQAALAVVHNDLHNELSDFLESTGGCIGDFKDARSLGGASYLGYRQPFRKDLRPSSSYFAVKLENSKHAAIAAWVGGGD